MADDIAQLISAIADGDRKALHALNKRASPLLFGILKKYFHNVSDAEDALHDVLVKVWRIAPRFDTSRKGMPWLVTVTRNHAIDIIRKRREQQFEDGQLENLSDLTNLGAGSQDMQIAIGQCLSTLRAKHATLLLEIYVWGYTYEEAAEKLDAPIGTIRTWVRRSVLLLRECMQGRDH